MSMEMRALGRSDLKIAPLMLGGNVFGWTADEPSSFAVLDTFVDGGFNAIDTADSYAFGDRSSEAIIGAWLKGRGGRHKLMIATKCGEPIGDKKGLSRAYILAECDQSLRRLGTDYIDLYQAHFDDPDTPQEETAEAYARLIEQGKVRVIGASNFTAERLKSALDVSAQKHLPRYESLQPRYNLADRDMFEGPLQELCLKEQIGVICYFGLASGFLTGKYRSEADLDKPARPNGLETLPQRARLPNIAGAGSGFRRTKLDPRSGIARLADGSACGDRTDRQRHERCTDQRASPRSAPKTQRRPNPDPQPRERHRNDGSLK
jgi:aryl-alcohol dehydrogenase-like predicted oxidoreductase